MQKEFPWELHQVFFQGAEVGCLEGADAHENPVGRSQTEVGQVAVLQMPGKGDAAGGHTLFRRAQGQRLQFLQAQGFEIGSHGATYHTAHVLEDGGGRELAYVKMSRARERTTVYAVCDDLEQAKGDLRREWGSERRQRWAIDTGTPITDPLAVQRTYEIAPETAAALRLARIDREQDVLLRSIPTSPDLAESAEGQRTRWMGEHLDVKMRLELMAFERGQLARTLDPAHEGAAPSMSR